MNHISFRESDHSYTSRSGERYTSVTQMLSAFKTKFDGGYWSYYKALEQYLIDNYGKAAWWEFKKHSMKNAEKTEQSLRELVLRVLPKDVLYIDVIQQQVLKQWDKTRDDACEKGTAYHLKREQEAYARGYEEHPHLTPSEDLFIATTVQGVYTFNLSDLPDGYYAELLVYNHQYKLAGQIDKCWVSTDPNTGERFIDICDWKGLALDTPIATAGGWKLMGELQEGDLVFDGNGVPTRVNHVSETHYNPCYKITFDTGETLIADHEHRWVIDYCTKSKQGKQYFERREYTTEELTSATNPLNKSLRVATTKLELPDIDLPIDPYILGLWLADGNRCAGTITCVRQDIWDEIESRGYKTSIDHNRNEEGKAESRTLMGLLTQLKTLNLHKNKHLPELYERASHAQRLDLLRGFMDGDGYLNRARKRCAMRTTKEWQRDAFVKLVSSLGWKTSTFYINGKGFGKTNIPMWDVCFTPTENPFLIRNTDYFDVVKHPGQMTRHRYIRKIELIDTVPTRCIAVASEDHTYLAGFGLIKTHNTNRVIKEENKYQKMSAPLDSLDDCNLEHYFMQICTYGWMLEQHGFTIRSTRFTHIKESVDFLGEVTLEEVPYICDYQVYKPLVEAMISHYSLNHP